MLLFLRNFFLLIAFIKSFRYSLDVSCILVLDHFPRRPALFKSDICATGELTKNHGNFSLFNTYFNVVLKKICFSLVCYSAH